MAIHTRLCALYFWIVSKPSGPLNIDHRWIAIHMLKMQGKGYDFEVVLTQISDHQN